MSGGGTTRGTASATLKTWTDPSLDVVDTRCCQEDHKTLKGYVEHYLNVHGGVVPLHQDPHPDHDHRHFKCCGQFHCGEPAFREHVALAHADVDVDEIRELAPELLGLMPDLPDEEEDADAAGEADAPDEADGDGDEDAEDGDDGGATSVADMIDESELEGLSGKERAMKKAKLIAEKKKEQGG